MNLQTFFGFTGASLVTLFLTAQAQQPTHTPLTLGQCIALSLKGNPQLLSSQYTVAESKERVREMHAAYFPTLSLNAAATRSSLASGKNSGETYTSNNYNAALSARYYLFRGFKTVAATAAALFSYDASTYQHESNRQDLILNVTQAYYKLVQAERLIRVAEKSVERARLHLDVANARVKAGVASHSDVLKAEVELSDAGLTLIRAKNGRLTAQGALNILLGRTAGSPILIVDDLGTFERNAVPQLDSLVAVAFQHRPELKRFDFQLLAQRSNIQYARSDYFPTISLDANYSFGGAEVAALDNTWSAGLTVSIPLFTGFSTSARVTQEEMALRSLEQQRDALRQQLSLDVWNAYSALKEAEERIDNTKTFMENAQENMNIAEGEYKEGLGSMIDVTDAQTTLLTAEQSHIEALADFKIAAASLERSLGTRDTQEK